MTTKRRRGLRATAAVALTGGLICAQALVSTAMAGTTTEVTWTPAAGPSLWSDGDCASGTNAPSSNPTSPQTDARTLAGTQTYAADSGPHASGASDTAWSYAPASAEVGPTVAIPTSTTDLSVDVAGPTSGRLLVTFTDTKGNTYAGVQALSATGSGWQTLQSSTLTWYVWSTPFLAPSPSWQPANKSLLTGTNTPQSLTDFFNNKAGTAQASFELGCSGAFSIDHLRVTDASTNVTDYDLQTPASATTITQGAAKVIYGGSTTIGTSTTSTDNGVTTTNPAGTDTLQSSTDGGATWTDAATGTTGTTFTVKPSRATMYRVEYASATPLNPQPSTSSSVMVTVAPSVRLSVSTSSVNIGKAVTFTTRLQPALPNVTVTFKQASGTSWVLLGTATTNASGVATLVRSRGMTGPWKVQSSIGAVTGYVGAASTVVTVKVYQPVSISIYRSYSTVYVGRTFRIYGALTPHWSGIPVSLQQYLSGRWVTVATGKSGTHGAYSFTRTAHATGTASFRVLTPASGYRRAGRSAVVKVSIVWAPVTAPPPPPPPTGGGGGGSGIG